MIGDELREKLIDITVNAIICLISILSFAAITGLFILGVKIGIGQ